MSFALQIKCIILINKKSLNLAFLNLRNHCMALLSVYVRVCVRTSLRERELVEERSARTGDVRLTSSHRLELV
jgi:hypothetical protein